MPVLEEITEFLVPCFLHGNIRTFVAPETSSGQPVAQPGNTGTQERRRLRDVHSAKTRKRQKIGGPQQVQAILEILLVQMNHVGLQLFPFGRQPMRGAQVQTRGHNSGLVIVKVPVWRANDLTDVRKTAGQFIHARMLRAQWSQQP